MKVLWAFLTLILWTQYGIKIRWVMLGMMVLMGITFYLYASQPRGDLYKMFYAQETVRDYFSESFFILQMGVLMMVLAQSIRMRNHPFAWGFMMVLVGRKKLWWVRFCLIQSVSVLAVWIGLLMMQVMLRWMPYDTGLRFGLHQYVVWAVWMVYYQSLFLFFEERSYSVYGFGVTVVGALLSLTMMPLTPSTMSQGWQWTYSVFPALGFFSLEGLWLGRWVLSIVILGWVIFGGYTATIRKDYSAGIET